MLSTVLATRPDSLSSWLSRGRSPAEVSLRLACWQSSRMVLRGCLISCPTAAAARLARRAWRNSFSRSWIAATMAVNRS